MKLKNLALALAIAGSLNAVSYAGVPVSVVADPQAWTAHLEDMAKYVEQIKQLENQFKQQVKQYESMTSARGLANVINSQYDTDALSGINTDSILRDSGINSASDFKLPEDVAELYDTAAKNAATYAGQASRSLEQAQSRFTELSGLVRRVNTATDPKEVMDLNARIGAEQAFLQNEVGKLQVLQQTAQANDALYQQKVKQMAVQSSGSLRNVNW
ncbi:type IV secretion system protein [Salmonella enterica subsp. enterica serovar Hartford]|uniref:Minor pilin of type IV secretion complex VirB5 n=2 Tax=Gammaproteobacteria TaxID=1236 RepID=A0A193PMQ7_KLEPN|nr:MULTISPECIES: type IV secretion system protein [Enterobacterales]EAP0965336.1 conjugal transfer protein [Salmonella enterica]EBV3294392.1 conjugal transfer protein [Salmonella enterica subsp. enterica serovar Typhimurium]EBV6953088.1 conjugal transfer protein [Salmonella enterica subsp. enterica serovar Saintpaul]ECD9462893.1 conjugal transfer protein [Salmonella enterica subsp. salamae]EDI3372001.1 conjugal transfer protein [Salmonella enterica subsp. enterica serovar Enteritidis]EDN54673